MKKLLLIGLFGLFSVVGFSQEYPKPINIGISYEKYASDNKRIHSLNIETFNDKGKFSYGVGAGTISIEHIGGYYLDGKTSIELIDKIVIDTNYNLSTGEIVYETHIIEVYDSVRKMFSVPVYKRYRYIKFPLFFSYEFFRSNKISLDVKANSTFIAKISEKLSNDLNKDITYYDNVDKNFYFLTGIGLNAEYNIYERVTDNIIYKKCFLKNLSTFISPIVHYAPGGFYSDKKIYFSFSIGLRIKFYYYNPELIY